MTTHEPTPNIFSAETFPDITKKDFDKGDACYINGQKWKFGELKFDETPQEELKNGYLTLIIFVTSWCWIIIIVGAILATITMYAIYGTAIERGNLMYETDDLIKQVQYNTDVIKTKVQQNADIMPKINENIEKLGSGIVQELKPHEAKIVNQ